MGWTSVRVELLSARPMQCYKYWSYGHVRFSCTSEADRSRSCFNCGKEGHSLRNCSSPPCCVICVAEGRNGDYRLGSSKCEVDRRPSRSRLNPSGIREPNRRAGLDSNARNDI